MPSWCWTGAKRVLAACLIVLAGCGPDLPSYGVVTRFSLTDARNRTMNSAELDGKVWVANFIFTNCAGPCPRMTNDMKRLEEAFPGEEKLRFVSFTVDPDRDTPEVLAAYAKRFRAGDRWYFLTGPQASLHELKRNTFKLGDVAGNLEHSTRFALVDTQGRIRGYYRSDEPDFIQQISKDIRKLL
jgi:protein SCO1